MTKTFLFSIFFFVSLTIHAQNSVVVQVENLKNDKGVCRAYLFDQPEHFPGEVAKAIASKAVKITGNKALLIFENVLAGTYAISVIHDENNNDKLDTNFLGIPKEGYGASKNLLPTMSMPTFTENAFEVLNPTQKLTIRIKQ